MKNYQYPGNKSLTLHRQSFIVDSHADTFARITSLNNPTDGKKSPVPAASFFDPQPIAKRGGRSTCHVDYHRLKKGGTNLQFMAIYTPPDITGYNATSYALRMLFEILYGVRESKGKISLIKSAKDANNVFKTKSTAFLIDIEGGNPLNKDVGLVKMFYDLGVRSMGLTHNPHNDLGDGITVKNPKGLTPFGKEVVRELDRLNMLVDVVHLAKPGFNDIARIATGPIISSHTGVRKLRDLPRNLDDEQLKEIARRKGMVGIIYLPAFIVGGNLSLQEAAEKKFICTAKDVAEHIAYVADKFGVDYVGLGSDFDGYGEVTLGIEDVSYLPNLTAELVKKGFNTAEIKKILGGNYIRVIKQVLK